MIISSVSVSMTMMIVLFKSGKSLESHVFKINESNIIFGIDAFYFEALIERIQRERFVSSSKLRKKMNAFEIV